MDPARGIVPCRSARGAGLEKVGTAFHHGWWCCFGLFEPGGILQAELVGCRLHRRLPSASAKRSAFWLR